MILSYYISLKKLLQKFRILGNIYNVNFVNNENDIFIMLWYNITWHEKLDHC